jgi:hypothetical protein
MPTQKARLAKIEAYVSTHYFIQTTGFFRIIDALKTAIVNNLPAARSTPLCEEIDHIVQEHLYGHEKAA